jgi:hypothetical protein
VRGIYSKQCEKKMSEKFWFGNLPKINDVGNLGVGGKIIECVLKVAVHL